MATRPDMGGPAVCAVPFTLKRSSDLWEASSYTTKTETVHGLLRLEAERLVIQWRLAVRTQEFNSASWTSKDEIEPAREVAVPLRDVAGAHVRRKRWTALAGPRLVVTAADLVAFDDIAGRQGLKLAHPAKLVFRIKRADRLLAEEFAAELALALAQLPDGKEEPEGARRLGGADRARGQLRAGSGAEHGGAHRLGRADQARELAPSTD